MYSFVPFSLTFYFYCFSYCPFPQKVKLSFILPSLAGRTQSGDSRHRVVEQVRRTVPNTESASVRLVLRGPHRTSGVPPAIIGKHDLLRLSTDLQ
jgi:hypothetical protein